MRELLWPAIGIAIGEYVTLVTDIELGSVEFWAISLPMIVLSVLTVQFRWPEERR